MALAQLQNVSVDTLATNVSNDILRRFMPSGYRTSDVQREIEANDNTTSVIKSISLTSIKLTNAIETFTRLVKTSNLFKGTNLTNLVQDMSPRINKISKMIDQFLVNYFSKRGLTFTSTAASLGGGVSLGAAALGAGAVLGAGAAMASTDPSGGLDLAEGDLTQGVGETGSATEAVDYFVGEGWTEMQAAAIVGNLQAESGANLQTDAVGDGGQAYGIAQWHPPRRAIFQQTYGKPMTEAGFKEQLEFVNWELNNSESSAGNKLREAQTVEEAAAIVDQFYERSAGMHRGQRISNAKALYNAPSATPTNNVEEGDEASAPAHSISYPDRKTGSSTSRVARSQTGDTSYMASVHTSSMQPYNMESPKRAARIQQMSQHTVIVPVIIQS
jgi:hypothetical protein